MKEKFLQKIFDYIEDIIILEMLIPSIYGISLAWREQSKITIFFAWFFFGIGLAGITMLLCTLIIIHYEKKVKKQKK